MLDGIAAAANPGIAEEIGEAGHGRQRAHAKAEAEQPQRRLGPAGTVTRHEPDVDEECADGADSGTEPASDGWIPAAALLQQ